MDYGIINLNIVPMRKKNNAKSEMINQLFFGECIAIIKTKEKWSFIRSNLDNYQGWIRNLHFKLIKESDYKILSKADSVFSKSEIIIKNNASEITIPTGSLLSSVKFLNYSYVDEGECKSTLETIKSFINSPYLWGGKTKFGVDCSGLVQSIYKTLNIILPRDSKEQSDFGVEISEGYKLGDLAFFGENLNKISHVGIFIDRETIVHAYGKVRMDKINSEGIYNNEEKRITHFLQKVNRIL
tara:strand:- start:215 stop:937 length:723 start_codon:yes stop_codon:yes gene_type:complete